MNTPLRVMRTPFGVLVGLVALFALLSFTTNDASTPPQAEVRSSAGATAQDAALAFQSTHATGVIVTGTHLFAVAIAIVAIGSCAVIFARCTRNLRRII